jgi:hypothetical protein
MESHRTKHLGAGVKRITIGGVMVGLVICTLAVSSGVASAHGSLAKARNALLVLSDMPKGWTSAKSSPNTPFPDGAQLASCLGVPATVITYIPPTANSPEFNSKNSSQSVQDNVSVYPSAKEALANLNSIGNAKGPQCLTNEFNGPAKASLESGFGSGASIGTITVARTPASDYAPHTANFTAFIPVTTQGTTVNIELTEVCFVKGDEEQTVTMLSVETPFPASLSLHLTKVADSRL